MDVIVYGASGHGAVVADTAAAAGARVVGFVDDREELRGGTHAGASVCAIGMDELVAFGAKHEVSVALGIGANEARRRVQASLEERNLSVATLVHPRAWVSPRASVGPGTVVFAGAVLQPGARLGRGCIVNTGATVDHDCVLRDHVHLSPGVHLGGTVQIGEGSHLGVGVSVRNNLRIGAWTVVGVGAAVVRDLPDAIVAYGVPARPAGG